MVGGSEGERIQTVTSKIKLHHYFLKVNYEKCLPFHKGIFKHERMIRYVQYKACLISVCINMQRSKAIA